MIWRIGFNSILFNKQCSPPFSFPICVVQMNWKWNKKHSNQKKEKSRKKLKRIKYVYTYKKKISPPVPPPVESEPYSLWFQRSAKATKFDCKTITPCTSTTPKMYSCWTQEKRVPKHAHSRTLSRIQTKKKWNKSVLLTPSLMLSSWNYLRVRFQFFQYISSVGRCCLPSNAL